MRSRVETIALLLVGAITLTGACATVRNSERRPRPESNTDQAPRSRDRDSPIITDADRADELARAGHLFVSSARALAKLRSQHCPRTGARFCTELDRKVAELMALAESAFAGCRAASADRERGRCRAPARRRVMVIVPAGS